jgi:chemotaxis protein CheD
MNHFIYPQLNTVDSPTALFARPATIQLIRMFGILDENIGFLEANVYGGATPMNASESQRELSRKNVEAAFDILDEYRIKIVGQGIGGHHGRKIIFNTSTGESVIVKVDRIREYDWFPERYA